MGLHALITRILDRVVPSRREELAALADYRHTGMLYGVLALNGQERSRLGESTLLELIAAEEGIVGHGYQPCRLGELRRGAERGVEAEPRRLRPPLYATFPALDEYERRCARRPHEGAVRVKTRKAEVLRDASATTPGFPNPDDPTYRN